MTRVFVQRPGPDFSKTARLAAVVLGTLPAALLLGASLALILPLPMTWGLRVGACALIPLWPLIARYTFLADCARDAWVSLIWLAALAALLSGSVLLLEYALAHGAHG